MSKIRRTAHSVELLVRRLRDAELGDPEPMELVGLHDELARIERKWLMQIAQGSERRKPTDLAKLDDWYARLTRLLARAIRLGAMDDVLKSAVDRARAACRERRPLKM